MLLKNAGGVLPLQPGRDQSVAVIGADGGQYALTSGGGSAGRDRPVRRHPASRASASGAPPAGSRVSYAQGDIPDTGALDRRAGVRVPDRA